jgi:hypothetical protein
MKSDTSVHVHNLDDPQEVIMKFEHNHYSYEGQDILSYISFEAKSFSNEVPVGKYVLKLQGNAIFKDSGTNTLEIQYSGGIRKIDFYVVGPKTITCYADFIKEW